MMKSNFVEWFSNKNDDFMFMIVNVGPTKNKFSHKATNCCSQHTYDYNLKANKAYT